MPKRLQQVRPLGIRLGSLQELVTIFWCRVLWTSHECSKKGVRYRKLDYRSLHFTMLITKDFHDVPTKLARNGRPIRIFVISPNVPGYPQARFPGM